MIIKLFKVFLSYPFKGFKVCSDILCFITDIDDLCFFPSVSLARGLAIFNFFEEPVVIIFNIFSYFKLCKFLFFFIFFFLFV